MSVCQECGHCIEFKERQLIRLRVWHGFVEVWCLLHMFNFTSPGNDCVADFNQKHVVLSYREFYLKYMKVLYESII